MVADCKSVQVDTLRPRNLLKLQLRSYKFSSHMRDVPDLLARCLHLLPIIMRCPRISSHVNSEPS